jgi:hypothetical protein
MYDPDFSKLPDRVVVTAAQACDILGISHDTLSRLHQRGEGPPRIKLSVRCGTASPPTCSSRTSISE